MEQARYWMWARTRCSSRPHLSIQIPGLIVGSSNNETWEEKAFAEDMAGHLGGCIWPPRSYPCSFCRREFRSAQALGGHMNVHRIDRARLRELSSSLSGESTEEQQHRNPSVMMGAASPNPNSGVLASPSSPRVSVPSTHEDWTENSTLFSPSFSSSITREKLKESLFSTTRSLEHSTPLHLLIVPEFNLGGEKLGSREFGSRIWRDPRAYDEETNWNKRRRTDPTPAFFVRPSSDQQQVQSEVLNHNPVEELDLELRLGGASKIK